MVLDKMLIIAGTAGFIAGGVGYVVLRNKLQPRRGTVSSHRPQKQSQPPSFSHLSLDAWDELAIEKIADYTKQNGWKAVSVRKKSSIRRLAKKLSENAITDLSNWGIFLSGEQYGLLVPLNDEQEEDWTGIKCIEARKTSPDALPDHFLVSSEGRYARVEVEGGD